MDPDEEKDDSFRSVDRHSDRTRRGSEENGLHRDGSYDQDDGTGSVAMEGTPQQRRSSQRGGNVTRVRSKSADAKASAKTAVQRLRARIAEMIESQPVSAVMTVFTIYSLYEDDVRLLATTRDDDDAFVAVITFCFFLFLLELCLLAW